MTQRPKHEMTVKAPTFKYGRAMGRLRAPDPRDRKHLLRPGRSDRTSRYWADSAWFGDQGSESSCVGFAWAHWLCNAPLRQWVDPSGVYRLAQFVDEWPGEDYDGTSVRAGAKVVQSLGFIQEYKWATTLDAVVYALLEQGPVVVGTEWFEDMLEPDERGHVRPAGYSVGGHAYLLNGVNVATETLRIKNSWGREWGNEGRALISFNHFAELLAYDGEACLAIERKAEPE